MTRLTFKANAFAFCRLRAVFHKLSDDGWEDPKASLVLCVMYLFLMKILLGVTEIGIGHRLASIDMSFMVMGSLTVIVYMVNALMPESVWQAYELEFRQVKRLTRFIADAALVIAMASIVWGFIAIIEATKKLPS